MVKPLHMTNYTIKSNLGSKQIKVWPTKLLSLEWTNFVTLTLVWCCYIFWRILSIVMIF